jgi:general secretion pathway protein D
MKRSQSSKRRVQTNARSADLFVLAAGIKRVPQRLTAPAGASLLIASLLIAGPLTSAAQTGLAPSALAKSAGSQQAAGSATTSLARSVDLKPDAARADQAYLDGARAVDRDDLQTAQADFARAVQLSPARQTYALAFSLTRERRIGELIQQAAAARIAGKPAEADSLLADARRIDPTSEHVLEHPADRSAAVDPGTLPQPEFAPPIQLTPTLQTQQVDANGDIRQVITQVGSQFGIKSIYDESVAARSIRFDLGPARFERAMPLLLKMGHLFAVPLDNKTQFVLEDTPANRIDYVRQVEETLFIPAATTPELNELVNIVKNIFDVKSVVASQTSGTLALRAPESTIAPLNYTIANLVDAQSDIDLELKLFNVDRSHTRNTGVQTPTSIGAFSVAAEARSLVSANQALITQAISSGALTLTGNTTTDLLQEAAFLVLGGFATDARLSNLVAVFGHGLTLFGVNLGSNATLNLTLNSADARALDALNVRAGNKETTTLHIGSKYPVTTSTFSSGISSSTAALLKGKTINGVSADQLLSQFGGTGSSAVTPTITFEDLGITLKTTPTVLKSGLIGLHIDLKIEALTGVSLDNIPVLASRVFVSDIAVDDGKTAVLLSSLSKTEASSVNGIPGLAELPGFRDTAADHLSVTSSSELVVLLTPHIVHRRSSVITSRVVPFTTATPQEF